MQPGSPTGPRATSPSPTVALLVGLVVTLVVVVAYSWYVTGQIAGLRRLQTELADGARLESLQLLRVQNDLNQLGLAMRDMLEADQPYPLAAWSAQFDRTRRDLEDALARQATLTNLARASASPAAPQGLDATASGERSAEAAPDDPPAAADQRRYLAASMTQFWGAADRMFELARSGREPEARAQIRESLQARQAALSTMVARLLVQNNESEQQTAQEVQAIYGRVQRQAYWFLAAALVAIAATSLILIQSNRRLFAHLESLSDQRRTLAQQLISTRESVLREISRELHDEFGQLLTAMGAMLGRAGRHAPADSALRAELREIGEVAQSALENVRGLSQTLHPSLLEDLGLESTIDWYVSTVAKQLGITVSYEKAGTPRPIDATLAIHVYRVLQEAVSNVARHSGAGSAIVRLRFEADALRLEVQDGGKGLDVATAGRGLGLVTMRERAALVGGTLDVQQPPGGGTLVRLRVPWPA